MINRITYLLIPLFIILSSEEVFSQYEHEDEEIYTITDEPPVFKYNNEKHTRESLTKYMKDSLRYPSGSKCKGKVFVEFIVEKDGSIQYARTIKGLKNCKGYNEEAVRIIKTMPDWIPARHRGENVRVRMILPIVFGTNIVFLLYTKETLPVEFYDNPDGTKQLLPYDTPPTFPGGIEALNEYIMTNGTLSSDHLEEGGEIFIEFTINKNGLAEGITIIRDFDDEKCNLEATRLIWNMPKWNPGEKDGEYVDVKMILPITIEPLSKE